VAPGTGRFDYLDGIRAIAIGAVMALHWVSWYSPFFHGGAVGVDVFFVLSGFIITTVLWRSPASSSLGAAWTAFVRRRVARLYPALVGLVVGAVALYAVAPHATLEAAEVARRGGLTLAQTSAFWAAGQQGSFWLPALHPFGQAWSLAIEWYFYLLWPLLVLSARARGWSPGRLALVSLGAATPLYLLSLPLSPSWFYFGPTARFAELLVGAALALRFQERVPSWPGRSAAPASAVALSAIALYSLVGPDGQSLVYRWVGVPSAVLATVVLIHAGYGAREGPVHRLLSHRLMAAVGRHSYSLYLWHIVPLLLLETAAPDAPKLLLGVAVLLATLVLTVASYRMLERPFLRARSEVLPAGVSFERPRPQQQLQDEPT
jgi:peptidoglycan/LPS O-acetylase OafA/YrhL